MEVKAIKAAINQISDERGIPFDKVLEVFEQALASAFKKEYGRKGQKIKAKIDLEKGKVYFWQVKMVVDEKEIKEGKVKFNEERHILLEEARKINPEIKSGEELLIPLEANKEDYGRIAAQTAKQVILQKLKELEREIIFQEFVSKEGEIMSALVQRIDDKGVYLNLGKALGFLPKAEQVAGEFYKTGQRLMVYVLKVEQTPKGPSIVVSRSHPKLISKLFELEVPEIQSGQVEIKSIAREAGSRTKISVLSKVKEIDPIGAMVGHRGTRVGAVINELGGEKIDIVLFSEKPEEYIKNAFSPAKVLEVKILPKNVALVVVPDDQLSLAIGKDGQNVRLVAKLTNWKIDVKSKSALEKEKLETEQKVS